MNEEILSRQILMVLFFFHVLFTYLGSTKKINVPAKVYNTCFGVEVLLVTLYIIYTCITEPFYNGIVAGLVGYFAVYVSIWLSYISLKHWTIAVDKIYDFYPENVKKRNDEMQAVGGYITESGREMFVYVDNDEYLKNVRKDVPVKIKYREWKNFAAHFDLADMQV